MLAVDPRLEQARRQPQPWRGAGGSPGGGCHGNQASAWAVMAGIRGCDPQRSCHCWGHGLRGGAADRQRLKGCRLPGAHPVRALCLGAVHPGAGGQDNSVRPRCQPSASSAVRSVTWAAPLPACASVSSSGAAGVRAGTPIPLDDHRMNVCMERLSDPAGHRGDLKITRAHASRAGEDGSSVCVWDLGLGSPPPHTLASWRNWPPANLELSRVKLWAFLVCLFPGGFQRLSRIMSHPCSALPLASPCTLDRISSTFPSTARKALSAVSPPHPFPCVLSSLVFSPG